MDVLTAGPIVRESVGELRPVLEQRFCDPVGATMKELPTEKDRKAIQKRLEENVVPNKASVVLAHELFEEQI